MADQWIKFVENFDALFEEAVKITVRNSLKYMYEALHGDGTTGPSPLIKLNISLKNNKITFSPTTWEIASVISETLFSLVEALQHLPRLVDKFHITDTIIQPMHGLIDADPESNRIQQRLNEGNNKFIG